MISEDISDFSIKLADFGFARFYDKDNKLDDGLGSPIYIAPEIILQEKGWLDELGYVTHSFTLIYNK